MSLKEKSLRTAEGKQWTKTNIEPLAIYLSVQF